MAKSFNQRSRPLILSQAVCSGNTYCQPSGALCVPRSDNRLIFSLTLSKVRVTPDESYLPLRLARYDPYLNPSADFEETIHDPQKEQQETHQGGQKRNKQKGSKQKGQQQSS